MKTTTLEKKYLVTNKSTFPLEVARTNGSTIISTDGKKYIDLMMGWCVGNLGWGLDKLREVVREYDGPEYIYPGFHYKPWAELAGLLATIAPGDLKKCFRSTGGSESVETAMQIAMAYTGRKKFVSIRDAYHGNTIGALSIGATANREELRNLLPGCYHIDLPLDEKSLKKSRDKN